MNQSSEKVRKEVKCEGRFGLERDYLTFILPTILEDRTVITSEDLKNMWILGGDEIIWQGNPKDPYYDSRVDKLRKRPRTDELGYLSLVPLIESPPYHLEIENIKRYILSLGNKEDIASRLQCMGRHPRKLFRECLGKEPNAVSIPNIDGKGSSNLSGYTIVGDIGIGTIISGGTKGSGTRSDSPFLLGVYKNGTRGELDLTVVIGFWAQDNEMLISQIQSNRNARFPESVDFGVAALRVAEEAAKGFGFDRIVLYNAKNHPIFYEHPETKSQLERELAMVFDCSAKKLGYDGSRNYTHIKDLTKNSHPK